MTGELRIDEALAEHGDFVRRLARSLLVDEGAAEDVAQETWVAALGKQGESVTNVRGWLAAVVRNLARFRVRSDVARRRREEAAAREDVADDPAELLERLDEARVLLAAVRELREPYRSVVLLRYREGLPPRVIAARRSSSVETVKSQLKRGLSLLREELTRRHDGDEERWRKALVPLVVVPVPVAWRVAAIAAVLALVASSVLWLGNGPGLAEVERSVRQPASIRRAAGGDSETRRAAMVAPTAPVRSLELRLVGRNGDPVTDYVVRFPGALDRFAVSDADGRIDVAYTGSRPRRIVLLDDPRLGFAKSMALGQGVREVVIDTGPMFRFALVPPPRGEQSFDATLSAVDPRMSPTTSFAPVRDGSWARFRATDLPPGPPWRLEVRSDDGFTIGHALVDRDGAATTIRTHDGGRVAGTIASQDQPLARATVELASGDRRFETATDDDGHYDLSWVLPGRYELSASSPVHARRTAEVAIQVHATQRIDLSLDPLEGAGIVAGTIVSASGGGRRRGALTVLLNGPEGRMFTQRIAPAPEGTTLGTFRFHDIPAGRYRITVHSEDWLRYDIPASTIEAPARGLRIVRRDDQIAADHEITALDAVTGEAIEGFDVFVRRDGDEASAKVQAARGPRLVLRDMPADADVEWVLRANGYVPFRGTRADLSRPVRLNRGWGNLFVTTDADGRPVAGVRLYLDGEIAGATDAAGRLVVVRSSAPKRVSVAGFVIRGGDVWSEDGRFRDLIWAVRVVVDPN